MGELVERWRRENRRCLVVFWREEREKEKKKEEGLRAISKKKPELIEEWCTFPWKEDLLNEIEREKREKEMKMVKPAKKKRRVR